MRVKKKPFSSISHLPVSLMSCDAFIPISIFLFLVSRFYFKHGLHALTSLFASREAQSRDLKNGIFGLCVGPPTEHFFYVIFIFIPLFDSLFCWSLKDQAVSYLALGRAPIKLSEPICKYMFNECINNSWSFLLLFVFLQMGESDVLCLLEFEKWSLKYNSS